MRIDRPDREPDLEFRVVGIPAPGGSKTTGVIYRTDKTTGAKVPVVDAATGKIRTFVKDSSGEGGIHWRNAVAEAGHEAMAGRDLLDGALYVELTIIRKRGPSHYGQGRNRDKVLPSAPRFPSTAPDVTKLVRSTEDALNSVVWRDDSINVGMHVEKIYGEANEPAGCEIRIWQLPDRVGRVETVPVDQMVLGAVA